MDTLSIQELMVLILLGYAAGVTMALALFAGMRRPHSALVIGKEEKSDSQGCFGQFLFFFLLMIVTITFVVSR